MRELTEIFFVSQRLLLLILFVANLFVKNSSNTEYWIVKIRLFFVMEVLYFEAVWHFFENLKFLVFHNLLTKFRADKKKFLT